MAKRIEDLVRRMGGEPIDAIVVERGDGISPYVGRAGKAFVIAIDALYIVEYTPGEERPTTSSHGEIPAWSLEAKRVEWNDAPALRVTGSAGGSRGWKVGFALGEDALPTIYRDEGTTRVFAAAYAKRWGRARTVVPPRDPDGQPGS
jgi:hypothetical protein